MSKLFRLTLASSSFVALLAWSTSASAQIFEPVDPVLDGNASDQDYGFPDRPLTLPEGTVEASAQLAFVRFSSGGFDSNFTTTLINGSFGLTNDLELGVATFLAIDPEFEWGESLSARGVFQFLKGEANGDPFELAFDGQVVLNFADFGDTLPFAVFGAPLRYKINDQMYILAGQNAITLGLEASILNIAANGAFVYLVNPDLTLRADTQLFNLALRDGDSTLLLIDNITLALTAIYQVLPLLDATVGLTINNTDGLDFLFVTGGVLSRF